MPDLPVRWDERVVRYLQYFRDDPRGHATFANLYRHSGRWRDMMRRALRRKGLPEDLIWVSMIESGFDQTAHSLVGAQGLWQLMPETAKIYGLAIDRWLDQRLSATVATDAAADLLGDLHRRFGSWELALGGFNMGYGGLVSIVKRYNTNDFWALERTEGALPWETSLYVPKVFAAAVVAHNLATFGFADVVVDPPIETDQVNVAPGTSLATVAVAAQCTTKDIESLNPELRASRTPPAGDADAASVIAVSVPHGKGAAAVAGPCFACAGISRRSTATSCASARRSSRSRQAHKTTTQKVVELNAIAPGEAVRGGTSLLVPHIESARPAGAPVLRWAPIMRDEQRSSPTASPRRWPRRPSASSSCVPARSAQASRRTARRSGRAVRRDARADRAGTQDDDAEDLVELQRAGMRSGQAVHEASLLVHRRRRCAISRRDRSPRWSSLRMSSPIPIASASFTACWSATRSPRSPARSMYRPTSSRSGTTVDPSARLQEGMTLQAYVAPNGRSVARRRRAGERRPRPGRRVGRILRGPRARQGHEADDGARERRRHARDDR